MRVFKFGGASVKDADGVKNVATVLKQTGHEQLVVVVSAMGKTTNALEQIVASYLQQEPELKTQMIDLHRYHFDIVDALFEHKQHPVYQKTQALFTDLQTTLDRNKSKQYDYIYDQVVSYGELISTTIISEYLIVSGIC